MPYTIPTAAAFKVRYPVFVDVADATIDAALIEAAGMVDTSWFEADYQPAIMALAAHTMTLEGLGTSVDAQLAGFRRLKVGPLELERDVKGDTWISLGLYGGTVYGQTYQRLFRSNRGGPRVVRPGLDQT